MIAYTSAAICGMVLLLAGMLELIRYERGHRYFWWSAKLAAFGFFMLGLRYLYLVMTDDIGRLHIIGTTSIMVIGLARILACAQSIRQRM